MRLPGLNEASRRGAAVAPLDSVVINTQGDADTIAWNFSGGTGANEVGVGLGLFGADATLVQSGNIAGASGGFRYFDGVDDVLSFSNAKALKAAFAAAPESTIGWRVKGVDIAGCTDYRALGFVQYQTPADYFMAYIGASDKSASSTWFSWQLNGVASIACTPPQVKMSMAAWLAFDGWIVMSRTGSKAFAGWRNSPVFPKNYYDLDLYCRHYSDQLLAIDSVVQPYTGTLYAASRNQAVSSQCWSGDYFKGYVGAFLMSRKGLPCPSFVP